MTMRKVKPETMKDMGMVMGGKDMPMYPMVNFDANTLPEAKDSKVGTTYELTLQLTMRGTSQRKGRDGKEHGNFDFDVVGIEPGEAVKGSKVKRYVESDASTETAGESD